MKLRDLLPDLQGDANPEIVSITSDSRKVTKGAAFFAISGTHQDGMAYSQHALFQGAVAVIGEADMPDARYHKVSNVRRALSQAASRFYAQQPSCLVAVTGTSGKSSVAEFVRQIFSFAHLNAACLGTLGITRSSGTDYGSLTTPDSITLHKTLQQLAGEGITHVAMEASSHGLDQFRLDGVRLKAAAFTNLGRDHLDYHPTIDDYRVAKLRLFSEVLPQDGVAVINMDGEDADYFLEAAKKRNLQTLTTGFKGHHLRLKNIEVQGFYQLLTIFWQQQDVHIKLPLIGTFQIENALVAAGLALAVGVPDTIVFSSLEQLQGVKGRLERVAQINGAMCIVDYAHKPDALKSVLETLRPFTKGRLIVVFGCGGDRDQGKRPLMGQIASDYADMVIVTDDNPRSENPAMIRSAILAAVPQAVEIADRREAILFTIKHLQLGDVLVVAGKGHETGQIVANQTLPFSDHKVLEEAAS